MLLLTTLLGLIPAGIARAKGRSFLLWWLYGAWLPVAALPHAILLRREPD